MKAIFNPDGTMFMVGPDHMKVPPHMEESLVWFPDDLDFKKKVQDKHGNSFNIEVTKDELQQRYNTWLENYVNARKLEYPEITEQLDILYHVGYEGWRKAIEEIKAKHPKPVSTS